MIQCPCISSAGPGLSHDFATLVPATITLVQVSNVFACEYLANAGFLTVREWSAPLCTGTIVATNTYPIRWRYNLLENDDFRFQADAFNYYGIFHNPIQGSLDACTGTLPGVNLYTCGMDTRFANTGGVVTLKGSA